MPYSDCKCEKCVASDMIRDLCKQLALAEGDEIDRIGDMIADLSMKISGRQ